MNAQPRRALARSLVAVAAALAAGHAAAIDFSGYMRAGPVSTANDVPDGGYSLGLDGQKFRLGNEGDFYTELLFSQTMKLGGIDTKIAWGPSLYSPDPNPGDASFRQVQAYVEMTGLPFSPLAKVWGGKRFWQREDVHIVDTYFFTPGNDVGVGMHDVPVGSGKFGIGVFSADPITTDDDETNRPLRITADFYELPVNEGGKLRIQGSYVHGDFANGNSGFSLTAKHDQTVSKELTNSIWLQGSSGYGALNNGFGNDDATRLRLVDSIVFQYGAIGGQALVGFERSKYDGGETDKGMMIGGRLSYDMATNFKLIGELGHNQRKVGDGPQERLTKFTIAPTLTVGTGFWARPELRLYVTTTKMNTAGAARVGLQNGKTSATIVGAQVEAWW